MVRAMRPFGLARLAGLAMFVARVGVFDTLELLRGHALHDYASFHAAACSVRAVVSPYRPEELLFGAVSCGMGPVHPYLYPPLLAEALVPITFLSPWTARLVWHALSIVAALLSVWLLDRWLGERERGEELRAAFAVIAASFWPIRETHLMGQVNTIVLLLLVVWWTGRDRSHRAAIALGAAVAIKMSPALLLLVPLVERRWRELAWGAASGAGLIVLSCLALGARGLEFLSSVLLGFLPGSQWHGLRIPIDLYGNHSLAAVLFRISPSSDPHRLGGAMALVQLGFIAAMVALWFWRSRAVHEHARAASLIVVMMIATTFTWEHHVTFALLAIAMLLAAAPTMGSGYAIAGAIAVAFMSDRLDYYQLPATPATPWPRTFVAFARSPKLPSLLALYVLGLLALRTAKPDAVTRTSPEPSASGP
jgi:hypothetical protein